MREIKFRAWDAEQKQMVMNPLSPMCGDKYPINTLMQFTGLNDKNGAELYEGDIVRMRFHAAPDGETFENGVIQWNERSSAFKWFGGDAADLSGYWLQHADTDYREVIGNIYSNPDLLK